MITELQVQTGIVEALREKALFEPQSVVINDWSVLDSSGENSPYVRIETATDYDIVPTPGRSTLRIPVNLIVLFGLGWDDALIRLRDAKQEIVDALLEDRPTLELEGVQVLAINGASGVEGIYNRSGAYDDAVPVYLQHTLEITVELF